MAGQEFSEIFFRHEQSLNKAKLLLSKIRTVDYLIIFDMPALFRKFAQVSQKIPDPIDVNDQPYAEARMQLQAERMNKLPAARHRDVLTIALEVVRELPNLLRRP